MASDLNLIVQTLDELLQPENYRKADISWNGLQVEAANPSIKKVGVAVDGALSVIEQAVSLSCDLLIVHHGLFWGESPSPMVSGSMGKKIRALIEGGCSLYASHLPLDGNEQVGNAFELARELKLKELEASFEYHGATVGVLGRLSAPVSFEQFRDQVFKTVIPDGSNPITCELPFGPEKIQTVGVATGSASSLLEDAKSLGCDLLLSGEPKHEAYHLAKEVEIHGLFAGHYLTETYGVKAVGKFLEEKLKIEAVFIDEPSGI